MQHSPPPAPHQSLVPASLAAPPAACPLSSGFLQLGWDLLSASSVPGWLSLLRALICNLPEQL